MRIKRLYLVVALVVFSMAVIFKRMSMSNQTTYVTQFVQDNFLYPHPYAIHFVDQYRFIYHFGEFLVRLDKNQQVIGGLAKSWDISDDRKKIVFHLRDNIYSAEEVRQSLQRIKNFGQTAHSNFAAQIIDMRVLSPRDLEIEVAGDAASILRPLEMADAVILPDDHWIKDDKGNDQVDWAKTRGPYVWKSGTFPVKPGDVLNLVPNKKHYLYEKEQLDWKIMPLSLDKFSSFAELDQMIEKYNGILTIRYSNEFKLYKTQEVGTPFYQTKYNGVSYIQLNQLGLFSDRNKRRTFLRKVMGLNLDLLDKNARADQIPQPGLSGRISRDEVEKLMADLNKDEFSSDDMGLVKISVPANTYQDEDFYNKIIKDTGFKTEIIRGTIYPMEDEWNRVACDAVFLTVGMSDTDPISAATFLFSEKADNADLPDKRIIKILNNAKQYTDSTKISLAIQNAFKTSFTEATLIPLFYVSNRHYHSRNLELNMKDSDPYAEEVKISAIRSK